MKGHLGFKRTVFFKIFKYFQISLIDIPALLLASYTIDHLGRKTLHTLSLGVNTIGCLAAAFIEDGTLKTALSMIGTNFLSIE